MGLGLCHAVKVDFSFGADLALAEFIVGAFVDFAAFGGFGDGGFG